MVTFYMVAITGLTSGTVAYLIGASKEWEKHRRTVADFNDLAAYSNEIVNELIILRAASGEAVGSGHPSITRRSHLQLVK